MEEMLEDVETYGIIVIERQHADVVLLRGKRFEIISNQYGGKVALRRLINHRGVEMFCTILQGNFMPLGQHIY